MSFIANWLAKEEFLPFARPCISKKAVQEVVECIRSGWITTGPRVQQFERLLREYIGISHAITFFSATAGLHTALLSLDLQPDDEVITTAMTFVCTANTIVQAGGKPVFVDIDPFNYNLDLNQVERAISSRTKAIIPVHFAGYPVDLDHLYYIAEKYSLRVIEDCAHAIGAEYKSKKLGSFGDIQVFSFHPNKNMTTGEGGCVATKDYELVKRLQSLKFHGIDRETWNRFSKSGSQIYDVIEPGFKYNMMDMQAALGIHQIKELDGFINSRERLAYKYLEILKDWKELQLPRFTGYVHKHAWHLFNPLILSIDRDDFIAQMKEKNIGVGMHFQPVHLFKYYRKKFGYKPGDFPVAEMVGRTIVSLPLFPTMTESDQLRVINAMESILRKVL